MYKILFTTVFIFTLFSSDVIASEDISAKQAFDTIIGKSIEPYDEEVLFKMITSAGYSVEEARSYADDMMKVIKSPEFRKRLEAIYNKHFSLEELTQISQALSNPAFSKFLQLKPIIQQEMMIEVNNEYKSIK